MDEPEVSKKEEPRAVQSFMSERLDRRGCQPEMGTAARIRPAQKAGNPTNTLSLSVKRQPGMHVSSRKGSEWRH